MNPKVSICIPTYNSPKLFRSCLESIVIQTYKDYEIIVTDDSTNEEIENIINEFNFGNKIKYFKNRIRLGTPENWNEASRHASGDYIKMLHHDDKFYDENSLFDFVMMLEKNPDSNFAFCASQQISETDECLSIHSTTTKQLKLLRENPNFLFLGNFIGAPSTTIYKKDNMIEYDIKLRWLVDIDFYIRKINDKFIYSSKTLVKILEDGKNQVTREFEKNLKLQKEESIYLFNKIKKTNNFSYSIIFYKYFNLLKIEIKKILIKTRIIKFFNKND